MKLISFFEPNQKFIKKTIFDFYIKDIPEYFQCVISLDLFKNPITTPSGLSYEKQPIFEYIESADIIEDPMTKKPFTGKKDCY